MFLLIQMFYNRIVMMLIKKDIYIHYCGGVSVQSKQAVLIILSKFKYQDKYLE